MWFECEQPLLSGERCVTSRKTAAKETTRRADILKIVEEKDLGTRLVTHVSGVKKTTT